MALSGQLKRFPPRADATPDQFITKPLNRPPFLVFHNGEPTVNILNPPVNSQVDWRFATHSSIALNEFKTFLEDSREQARNNINKQARHSKGKNKVTAKNALISTEKNLTKAIDEIRNESWNCMTTPESWTWDANIQEYGIMRLREIYPDLSGHLDKYQSENTIKASSSSAYHTYDPPEYEGSTWSFG